MRGIDLLRDRLTGQESGRLLLQAEWGLEKESQRINPDGTLALSPHPAVLGDKLTHPYITTDFAESQLELITPPLPGTKEALARLEAIHDEVDAGLGEELLWPLSMPPILPAEANIPIARYGDSQEGRAREQYRADLADRYGKKMQMICGLHVNFSYGTALLDALGERRHPDLSRTDRRDALYFAAARNFLRYRWLLIYLFGASPNFDPTYDQVVSRQLEVIEHQCPSCTNATGYHDRYATSLRVSRYGYANDFQRPGGVSFNSREQYVDSFRRLLGKELKTESEWYSPIRLKSAAAKGESQLAAMERSGVKYMEVRLLDLDPYERIGISRRQLDFLHLFMLCCLLEDSPPIDEADCHGMQENHNLVSLFGRKPELALRTEDGGTVRLSAWAGELLDRMEQLAGWLGRDTEYYRTIIREERAKVEDPERTPSAVMQREMEERGETFAAFGLRLARQHKKIPLAGGTS